MGINQTFWRNKKVLVTGHTGFKGSWLSLWLNSMGAKVTGYALSPPTTPSLFEVAHVADSMVSVIGDVCDAAKLQSVITEHQPEIVIHMAAQALVRPSYANPVETYATNVMGTVNLLEAVRQTDCVRAVVNVTTDKCYDNKENQKPFRESDAMGGYDPYSSSKACSEIVTAAYRSSFFNQKVALASARAGNVIGGGDWALDRLIPDIMRSITEQRPVLIRSPNAIRPWQHVLEPLSGYLMLAEKLYLGDAHAAEAWNFGPNEEDTRTVQWIVEKLTQEWGEGAAWVVDEGNHPHEAHYLKLDCSKAKMQLNWQPRWSLAVALQNIIAWHKAHLAGRDMRDVTLKQIETYSNA
ncbi:MAG: CDP-glucose 4,6-dehydratase [Methylophilaceae bacterium]